MRIRRLLMSGDDRSTSAGLLVLRVFVGLPIFIKHGIEKLTGYSTMVPHFPEPQSTSALMPVLHSRWWRMESALSVSYWVWRLGPLLSYL